jgi:hypothetical protein
MAGTIKYQEGALLTVGAPAVSITNGSAVLVGTLDCHSGGTAADMFAALFSLSTQWATTTGIAAGTTVADLYLVPALDGVNFPDIDTTTGSSYIPYTMRAGSFVSPKALSANTPYLFQSGVVELMPVLYNVYIINRSGQTISSGWSMKAVATAAQYT